MSIMPKTSAYGWPSASRPSRIAPVTPSTARYCTSRVNIATRTASPSLASAHESCAPDEHRADDERPELTRLRQHRAEEHAVATAHAERLEACGSPIPCRAGSPHRRSPTRRGRAGLDRADPPRLRRSSRHRLATRGILCGGPSLSSAASGTSSTSGSSPTAAATAPRTASLDLRALVRERGRVPDAQAQRVVLRSGADHLEQAHRARVDGLDRGPHVDRQHRPAVDDDLVTLAADRPHARVRTSARAGGRA